MNERWDRARTGDSGACPDANRLAGLASGSLLPEERDAVVEHLAECAICREIAAVTVRVVADAPGGRVIRFGGWPRMAAVVLAASTVARAAYLLVFVDGTGARSTEERLQAAARELSRSHPDLFRDFRPLSAGELRAASAEVQRGGLALLLPAGRTLETRPEFRWEPGPGTDEYTVVLYLAAGTEVWRRSAAGAALAFPADRDALDPGARYVWEVSGRGPLGDVDAQKGFEVATVEQRREFDAALGRIESTAPAGVRGLLAAHYALRHRCLGRAERAARGFLAEHPEDKLGRATLGGILRRLGSSTSTDLEVGK